MSKWLAITFGILVACAVLSYVIFLREKYEPAHMRVRLGWVHQAQFAGIYVAQEKGFYQDEQLTIELLPSDPEIEQAAELAAGDVDVSVMEAHQLLAGYTPDAPIQAVAAIYQVNPHSLAVRADSGIDGPNDFGGKTLGFSGGQSEGSALFKTFISSFDQDSVKYVELGYDTIDDFKQRRADIIDLYRVDQPYLAEREGVPLTIIPLEAYGLSTYGDVLTMSKPQTEDERLLATRFVRATLRGWQYALDHPQEAVDITMQYVEGDYDDRKYQEHILYESLPLIRGTTQRLGAMKLPPWSTLYESMIRAEATQAEFDVAQVYTNDYLPR